MQNTPAATGMVTVSAGDTVGFKGEMLIFICCLPGSIPRSGMYFYEVELDQAVPLRSFNFLEQ